MVLTGIAKQLVAGPVALRDCIGQCCPHPEKGEIEHVFRSGVRCADVPPETWAEVAPVLPEEPAPPSLERAAAAFGFTETAEETMDAMTGEPEAKGGLGSRLGR
jgi:hypothetical protein